MYTISAKRVLAVEKTGDKLAILITDFLNYKTINLPAARWISFVCEFDNIDEAVRQLRNKQYVKYVKHIGGWWHVSVTTGFACIDIRCQYQNDQEIRPKRDGFAIRLWEWPILREIAEKLIVDVPELAAVQPCCFSPDHRSLAVYRQCPECSPFEIRAVLDSLKM